MPKRAKQNNPTPSKGKRTTERNGIVAAFADLERRLKSASDLSAFEKCRVRMINPFWQLHERVEFESKHRQWVITLLEKISAEASDGKLNGIRRLVLLSVECAKLLEQWAEKAPEYVALVAREQTVWPILVSSHLQKETREQRRLLKRIALGADNKSIDYAKEKLTDNSGANRWAYRIFLELDFYRSQAQGAFSSTLVRVFPDVSMMFADPTTLDEEIRKEARVLPPLNLKSAPRWWTLAKRVLLAHTKRRPWEVTELKNYANSKKAQATPGNGVRRDEVVKAVRQAFLRLATP